MTWQVWTALIKHGPECALRPCRANLDEPASARWCRRTQNQEALELDAEAELFRKATRVGYRVEVREPSSDEGKVKRKGAVLPAPVVEEEAILLGGPEVLRCDPLLLLPSSPTRCD